jgi:hypothetical protein
MFFIGLILIFYFIITGSSSGARVERLVLSSQGLTSDPGYDNAYGGAQVEIELFAF